VANLSPKIIGRRLREFPSAISQNSRLNGKPNNSFPIEPDATSVPQNDGSQAQAERPEMQSVRSLRTCLGVSIERRHRVSQTQGNRKRNRKLAEFQRLTQSHKRKLKYLPPKGPSKTELRELADAAAREFISPKK
jgi:hypothetical protein